MDQSTAKAGSFGMGFTRRFLRKLIIGLVWNTVSLALLLFLPAGTLDWWRAWVLVGVVGVCFVVMMVGVLRTRPDLMRERFKSVVQKGQPLVDRVLLLAFVLSYTAILVFIPLDVFRFHLLPTPNLWVSSIGMVLYIVGWWMTTLVFKENAFATPVVRHQEERNTKSSTPESTVWCGIRCIRESRWARLAWRYGWSRMRRRFYRSFPSSCWRRGSFTRNAFCGDNLRATMRTLRKYDFD